MLVGLARELTIHAGRAEDVSLGDDAYGPWAVSASKALVMESIPSDTVFMSLVIGKERNGANACNFHDCQAIGRHLWNAPPTVRPTCVSPWPYSRTAASSTVCNTLIEQRPASPRQENIRRESAVFAREDRSRHWEKCRRWQNYIVRNSQARTMVRAHAMAQLSASE